MEIQVEDLPNTPGASPVAAARIDPIAHMALAPRFGIDMPDKQDENKLAEVWAYARGVANSEDIQDIIWEVIHLEGVLGAPRLGEARIDRLYRYAKLKRQESEIQSQLRGVAGVETPPHLRVR